MNTQEFMEIARKALCCVPVYHAGPQQVQLFLNVNGEPCSFIYDEEMINSKDIDEIMSIIDDDLFLVANRKGGIRK